LARRPPWPRILTRPLIGPTTARIGATSVARLKRPSRKVQNAEVRSRHIRAQFHLSARERLLGGDHATVQVDFGKSRIRMPGSADDHPRRCSETGNTRNPTLNFRDVMRPAIRDAPDVGMLLVLRSCNDAVTRIGQRGYCTLEFDVPRAFSLDVVTAAPQTVPMYFGTAGVNQPLRSAAQQDRLADSYARQPRGVREFRSS